MSRRILLGVFLVFFSLFFFHKIFFINADLGRHIKNGEIIISGIQGASKVLSSNYYSYSETDFPLVNHHWGSGIIYYIIWKLFGFNGLSIFQIILNVITAYIFFKIAERKSNFIYAFFFLVLSIPLITSRTEIRPESFSYLFSGLFLYFLTLFSEKKISFSGILLIILPLQLFWVNIHIFFVFGILFTGIFWLSDIFNNKNLRSKFSFLMALEIIICFANPNGINGLIEPFLILKEYGYMIAENQSLFFMQNRFPEFMIYYHFEFLLLIAIIIFLWSLKGRRYIKFNPGLIIFLLFTVLSLKMIRGIQFWGFFLIPFASISLSKILGIIERNWSRRVQKILLGLSLLVIFLGFAAKNHYYSPFKGFSGMGLLDKIGRSADFIKWNKPEGPIFNNYDIGGYFIFNLFPEYRVFVDNRPEAYSVDFFKKIYEPMQEFEEKWSEFSEKYKFNCIYFYRHDNTPHAQPFLIRRINDDKWAPVFVDDYTIIFLKRNARNSALIKKYELPKSMFSAVH